MSIEIYITPISTDEFKIFVVNEDNIVTKSLNKNGDLHSASEQGYSPKTFREGMSCLKKKFHILYEKHCGYTYMDQKCRHFICKEK